MIQCPKYHHALVADAELEQDQLVAFWTPNETQEFPHAIPLHLDPVKVVRTTLENAISVASVLLLTEATMTAAARAAARDGDGGLMRNLLMHDFGRMFMEAL